MLIVWKAIFSSVVPVETKGYIWDFWICRISKKSKTWWNFKKVVLSFCYVRSEKNLETFYSWSNESVHYRSIPCPGAPVHKGSITNGTGGALLNYLQRFSVVGNFAYGASTNSNTLEIVDIGMITATEVTGVSPTRITCYFNLTGMPPEWQYLVAGCFRKRSLWCRWLCIRIWKNGGKICDWEMD